MFFHSDGIHPPKQHNFFPYAVLFSLAVFLLTALPAFAIDGRGVMQMVQEQGRKHATQTSEVELLIVDAEKRERKRFFKTRQLIDDTKTTRTLVRFFQPASVKDTALLTEKTDTGTKANQWLFLPAFRSVKQLKSDEQDESFMGSDFSYSDVAGRTLDQDTHKLTKETDKHFFVTSAPKNKAEAYSKLEIVVSKKFLVPLQILFYNQAGEKMKTLKNQGIQEIEGMYIVQKVVMQNHKSGGQSTMARSKTEVGIELHLNDVGIKALQKN